MFGKTSCLAISVPDRTPFPACQLSLLLTLLLVKDNRNSDLFSSAIIMWDKRDPGMW